MIKIWYYMINTVEKNSEKIKNCVAINMEQVSNSARKYPVATAVCIFERRFPT